MRIPAPVRTSLVIVVIILGGFLAIRTQGSPLALAKRPPLLRLSSDPYTNSSAQHRTEISPASFSFGSTIVTAFEAGVFSDGGSSNIGWATSSDNGTTWRKGFLPDTTVYAKPAGAYARISNPAVAYDAKHNTWLIFSLGIQVNGSPFGAAVLVSQSTDGGRTWRNPVTVQSAIGSDNLERPGGVCDNTNVSKFFGNCYTEWDNAGNGALIQMSTSSDGGNIWGSARTTADHASGLGGRPLVQPNGNVIVPIDNASESAVLAFQSMNGGASWSTTTLVSSITVHPEGGPGHLFSSPLVSAAIDDSGDIFLVWYDCRFENACSANDIVMSTSTDGATWSAVQRIPISPVNSGNDYALPAIAVQSTQNAQYSHPQFCILCVVIVVVFIAIIVVGCLTEGCEVEDSIESPDGGNTWSSAQGLTGKTKASWLADTNQGYTLGDYTSVSASSTGPFFPVFPAANKPKGTILNESISTVKGGIS